MKTCLFSIVILCVCLVSARPAQAQIPVTDAASLAAQVGHYLDTIGHWAAQVAEFERRANDAKQRFDSFTGARNLGDIFNDPAFRKYLPKDWQKVYDKTRRLGYAGASSKDLAAFQARQSFDACAFLTVPSQRKTCEAQAIQSTLDKGFAMEALTLSQKHLLQIGKLQQEINKTQDPKSIAELEARIAAEQAALAATTMQLNLQAQVKKAEQEITEQQAREDTAKTFHSREGIRPKKVKFSW